MDSTHEACHRRKTLSRLRDEKGITIMVSSHILDELSKIANSYGVIHEAFCWTSSARRSCISAAENT